MLPEKTLTYLTMTKQTLQEIGFDVIIQNPSTLHFVTKVAGHQLRGEMWLNSDSYGVMIPDMNVRLDGDYSKGIIDFMQELTAYAQNWKWFLEEHNDVVKYTMMIGYSLSHQLGKKVSTMYNSKNKEVEVWVDEDYKRSVEINTSAPLKVMVDYIYYMYLKGDYENEEIA